VIDMALLILLVALVALAVLSVRYGADSRDPGKPVSW
jgi:hypothetical protein